jgi:hypothetical protein
MGKWGCFSKDAGWGGFSKDAEWRFFRRIKDGMSCIPTLRVGGVSGVGAMDVSRSEAQRAETNVIARSVDRATIYATSAMSASNVRTIEKIRTYVFGILYV